MLRPHVQRQDRHDLRSLEDRAPKWLFSISAVLRFNTSLNQLRREIDVTYKTVHQRVQRSHEALNAPVLDLIGPVEINEVCVSAGKKGRERDRPSRSRGLSTRGRGSVRGRQAANICSGRRGIGQRYVIPAKTADEWDGDDEQRLLQALQALLVTDYHHEVNLGRYLPNQDPYLVR